MTDFQLFIILALSCFFTQNEKSVFILKRFGLRMTKINPGHDLGFPAETPSPILLSQTI